MTKTFISGVLMLTVLLGFSAMSNAAASSSMKLVAPLKGTIETGNTQTVKWTSTGGAPAVRINLIRQVSSNPKRFSVIRTVAKSTKNDGVATWVPTFTDVGDSLSIEIGCAPSAVACTASTPSTAIAVTNSNKYKNTASAFQAIEAAKNK